MRSKNLIVFVCFVAALSLLLGCATKIERVNTGTIVDFSGKFNDYDSLSVSKEMVSDCLSQSWIESFHKENGRNPVVIVGHVNNRSHEHINSQVFTKYLEREVMNSGKIVFVASSDEREQIRDERTDQAKGFTDPTTIAAIGKERGADYMLIGSINSVKDETKGKYVILYQVNLELIDLSTNVKAWIGSKEIKKVVKNPKYSL
ncbi:MAG: penicillin-binding protein activator LpoB [Candidatus Zapsychrus exili]|nr:penicillin-binding protein activator LpoB [Candidatus Zapsychrus exili]